MRKKNKNILKNPVFWIIVIFLAGLTVGLIIYFTTKTGRTVVPASRPSPGPNTPPSPGPNTPPPQPGPNTPSPPPAQGLTDCLALNYYGPGVAPQKICGVFDGFSHWSWAGMQQWLAYFSYKSGASSVIIYEAQFVPESWMSEVLAPILGKTKGTKPQANYLPLSCTSNSNCTGPTGTVKAPGANWICQNDICVDKCLLGTPPKCKGEKNKSYCADQFTDMKCPSASGAYCSTNGYCHYNSPHTEGATTATCTKSSECTCTGDACNTHSGHCHMMLPGGACPKPPPTAGGTCPTTICPDLEPGGGKKAYCKANGYCTHCTNKGITVPGPPKCIPKEGYTTAPTASLWSAWGKDKTAPISSATTAAFSNYYTSVGSLWAKDPTTNEYVLSGVKGDEGKALCPYGSFYNATKGEYGQCEEQSATCDTGAGETSMMGFCDVKQDVSVKHVGKGENINVYIGKDDPEADTEGYKLLQVPVITLTWYALVGAAQHQSQVAIDYILTVLGFCKNAGISRLAFPFIVPDLKNYASYMLMNPDGSPPLAGDAESQVTNAMNWLVTNLLLPAKQYNIEIGLNVYASYKDARWQQWWKGEGPSACFNDPCQATTEKACDIIPGCSWDIPINPTGSKSGCYPSPAPAPAPAVTERFTAPAPAPPPAIPMSSDPCPKNTSCGNGSCSWPYIATFIKLLNRKATTNGKAQLVSFLQVDQEWCHCGVLEDNIKTVNAILPNFEFTIATSLGTPETGTSFSVPEVYWDAGNQFPCTGGAGTYQYLTPPCTSWSSHKKLKNQPKAFYDLIVGDTKHLGSDDFDGKNQNAWLGRGKFKNTIKQLNGGKNVNIMPSFSIENLSMCSSPNEMTLTGDVAKGTGRWECTPPSSAK